MRNYDYLVGDKPILLLKLNMADSNQANLIEPRTVSLPVHKI